MFVEDWPSITWAVLDYYRQPKLAYSTLKTSMQPLLPSIAYRVTDRNAPLSLTIVNDEWQAFPRARARWQTSGGENKPISGEKTVDIPADGVIDVAQLGALPQVTNGSATHRFWIEDSNGRTLAENTLSAQDFINWKHATPQVSPQQQPPSQQTPNTPPPSQP
jgi:beta-mannosidase